ncbi:hypothetical protein LTR28_009283 [Elasticomyces elasticus]|nr:hypothetical protein LTR28_009283 [Elasticomyces elasticus]
MNPRSWFKDLTPYFIYLLFISTLGPALFGYHIYLVILCLVPLSILSKIRIRHFDEQFNMPVTALVKAKEH